MQYYLMISYLYAGYNLCIKFKTVNLHYIGLTFFKFYLQLLSVTKIIYISCL